MDDAAATTRWGVVWTQPSAEQRALRNAQRQGFTCLSPMCRETVVLRGRRTERVRPLFPRYIFVSIVARWRSLLGTHGVAGLVMSGDHPAWVPDAYIDELRSRADSRGLVPLSPPPKFLPNERVRCRDGALSDKIGIFEGTAALDRVRVLFDLLGRKVLVDLPEGDLVAA